MIRFINDYLLIFAILLSAILSIPKLGFGQENIDLRSELLTITNSTYGADDKLINGKYYRPKHFYAEGHPYFLTKDWQIAELHIKGASFKEIRLKYNIEDDVLIIRKIFNNRVSKNISLNNSFVDSLEIGTHTFHNTNNLNLKNTIGIAELICKGKIHAYIKHHIEYIEGQSTHNKSDYAEAKTMLYLLDNNSFISISSKNDLLANFSGHQKKIKQYMRKNKIRLKKAQTKQLMNLIHFCEQL